MPQVSTCELSLKITGFSGGATNLLFDEMFAEKCMKMKEIGLRGVDIPNAPFDPPALPILCCNTRLTGSGNSFLKL